MVNKCLNDSRVVYSIKIKVVPLHRILQFNK